MTSIRDRLDGILARIRDGGESRHVFTRLYEESARVEAEAADARRRAGLSLGPLDGRIVSIKDLFDVAGETTTAGSKVLRDASPAERDAPIVRRLRRAGAVIVGKTNMVEFAFSGVGLNPHYGTPGNAADPERIPGGSSSGAGVSVATGTSDIAIGTDTGGSVRIPASLNGTVGFKPSAGRVPLEGCFPLAPSLDSIGPLARTVQDCADADAVMAGEEPEALRPVDLRGVTLGVPRGRLFEETEPLVADAFSASLDRLRAAGARFVDWTIDDLLAEMAKITAAGSIAVIESAAVHADWLDSRGPDFDPRVHGRVLHGRTVSAPDYIRTMRRRAELIRLMDERLRDIGGLVLPTTAVSAPLTAPLVTDDKAYTRANLLILRNTMMANLFDLTAVSLPMPEAERPAGLMLVARNGKDKRLLALAAAVEAILR